MKQRPGRARARGTLWQPPVVAASLALWLLACESTEDGREAIERLPDGTASVGALDGDWALLGAPGAARPDEVRAVTWDAASASWVDQARLTASDDWADNAFGYAIALDGDVALISAPEDPYNSVFGFVRREDGWVEEQIIRLDPPEPGFGHNLALSGKTAVIAGGGVAHVFERGGEGWREVQALTVDDAALGPEVALSSDRAIVSATRAPRDG